MIKSIKKAIDILFRLSDDPETPMALSKLAADLDINVATCAHILQTLCDSLLVERISRKEGYRLGPGTYMLTRHGRYQESLIEVCSPVLGWLTRQLNVTVFLSVVCDGIKYLIYHIDVDAHIDFKRTEIVQGSIEHSASGILFMAYMDEESLNRVMYRSKSPASQLTESDREQFRQIRKNAYADYCNKNDMQSYAFSIFHESKRPVAAIGVLYANAIDTPELRARIISRGKYAASEISRRLSLSTKQFVD